MAAIDPRLTKALDDAKGGRRKVQAVVTLRSDDPSVPMDPARTEESVKTIVEQAARKAGAEPDDVVVFANLQSFSIEADAQLISDLIEDDAVDSASLNSRD
jgi:hypothetical protein